VQDEKASYPRDRLKLRVESLRVTVYALALILNVGQPYPSGSVLDGGSGKKELVSRVGYQEGVLPDRV
jgi:hypothetical protein